jgi:hypothetical protein
MIQPPPTLPVPQDCFRGARGKIIPYDSGRTMQHSLAGPHPLPLLAWEVVGIAPVFLGHIFQVKEEPVEEVLVCVSKTKVPDWEP